MVYLTRLSRSSHWRNLELNLLLTICHLDRNRLSIDMNVLNWVSLLHLLSRLSVDQNLRSPWLSRPHLLWHSWHPNLHLLAVNPNLLSRLDWLTIHHPLLLNTWLTWCLPIDSDLRHLLVSRRVDLLHRLVIGPYDPYLCRLQMRNGVYYLMYFERFL